MTTFAPWTEKQDSAMQRILLSWHMLSRGDISLICACIRKPDSSVLVVGQSPHALFWGDLVKIGWAEYIYSPVDPEEAGADIQSYRLVPGSETALPHFLVFYDLLNMGACTPVPDPEEIGGARRYFEKDSLAKSQFNWAKELRTFGITFVIVCALAYVAR